jgi:hypothetical protein
MAAEAAVMVVGGATRLSAAEVATMDAAATVVEVSATDAVAAVASALGWAAAAAAVVAEAIGVGLTACGHGVLTTTTAAISDTPVCRQRRWRFRSGRC